MRSEFLIEDPTLPNYDPDLIICDECYEYLAIPDLCEICLNNDVKVDLHLCEGHCNICESIYDFCRGHTWCECETCECLHIIECSEPEVAILGMYESSCDCGCCDYDTTNDRGERY